MLAGPHPRSLALRRSKTRCPRAGRRRSLANDRAVAGLDRARASCGYAASAAAEADLLHGLEVDERFVVVGDRAHLRRPRRGEIALRLEDKERFADSRGELLFFGGEPLFGELARRARRLHALLVRFDLTRRAAHLRDDLHFDIPQLRLRLLVLELRALEVGLGRARPERISDLHADRPRRVGALKDVAQHRSEAAIGNHRSSWSEA